MDGQQVRILRGEHEGRLGVVVDPALLCEENERGQVVKRPKVDARGRLLLTEPEQMHAIYIEELDESVSDESDDGDGRGDGRRRRPLRRLRTRN